MAFTKEDYMRLPKERLAELLVERDKITTVPYVSTPNILIENLCPYGGLCTNFHKDCVGCPKQTHQIYVTNANGTFSAGQK